MTMVTAVVPPIMVQTRKGVYSVPSKGYYEWDIDNLFSNGVAAIASLLS